MSITVGIKKITRRKLNKIEPIYCVSVDQDHEVIVSGDHGEYVSGQSFNFGLIFGAGATTVMKTVILPNWSEDECIDYIIDSQGSIISVAAENRFTTEERVFVKKETLEDGTVKTTRHRCKIIKYGDSESGKDLSIFYTVAVDTRAKFFKAYPDLEVWINNTKEFAKNHGYVRSPFGAFRRLPYLTYQGKDSDGKKISGYQNISLNSPIQNMEVCIVHLTMLDIMKYIKENNLKSFVFSNTHDALEMYVHKDEVKIIRDRLIEYVETMRPEYKNVPLEIEGNVSNPRKGQLWDLGPSWFKEAEWSD